MTSSKRDLRLDLFRGLALWFIFIDHIPGSAIADLTYRNFGFSDATEIFVFISGYTSALVFGSSIDLAGFWAAFWRVMHRVWQLYVAHILLFIVFVAQVSWAATRYNNPVFLDALNVGRFLDNPATTLVEALTLHYRPVNLDVLPLYIALLAFFPFILWMLKRSTPITVGLSAALYVGVQWFKWTWPEYADGETWYFNPLGWQFLFVIGAVLARSTVARHVVRWRPWLGLLAIAYLLIALVIVQSWQNPAIAAYVPTTLTAWMYPIEKSNQDVLRLIHFLSIAYLITHWIGPQSALPAWPAWRAVVRCGQHSLYIFCLSILLSFLAYFFLVEFGQEMPKQISVVVFGLLIMSAAAQALHSLRPRRKAVRE